MPNILDTDLRQVFADRELLDRVVRSIQLDRGSSYLDALESLHRGVDTAHGNRQSTLGAALRSTTGDHKFVVETLKVLERRDDVVRQAYERAAGPVMLEQEDERGLVVLDAGAPGNAPADGRPTADLGVILTDAAEQERRYARWRKLVPGFDGPDKRQQFLQLDADYARAGKDIVRTEERKHELRGARAAAQQVARQLDSAIAGAADKRVKLKALDAQIAQLKGPEIDVRDESSARLHALMADVAREPVRMLDQLGVVAQGDGAAARVVAWEKVQDRMRQLGRPQSDFLKTLQEMVRGEPAPAPADELASPAGVHPGNAQLHQRVLGRIRELDLNPDRDYAVVLDQIVREGLDR